MIRDVDIHEISDGRFYGPNDMVKADTGSCKGCSRCCHGMCDTIILEPLDVFRLERELGCGFEELLQGKLALRVADGLILPHLASVRDVSLSCKSAYGPTTDGEEADKSAGNGSERTGLMQPAKTKDPEDADRCVFLNDQGRCTIHAARPALCRLYPLGRYYLEGQGVKASDFVYILQTHECDHPRTKVKVKRWLDMPDLARYEDFVRKWHSFIRGAAALADADEGLRKGICMVVLKKFYQFPWNLEDDFYPQFEVQLTAARRGIGLA